MWLLSEGCLYLRPWGPLAPRVLVALWHVGDGAHSGSSGTETSASTSVPLAARQALSEQS